MNDPHDIASRARQLHEQGLSARDIGLLLNVHEQQIRRWLATADPDAAAEAHARAWSGETTFLPPTPENDP